LTVDDFETSSLLVAGENYGSTILKIRAVVRASESSKPRELHLIAKMLPPTQIQKDIFDSSYTVKKEIFFYDELFPAYQKLEKECGLEDEDVLDVLPKFYGARVSLSPDPDEEVDEDAVILLENLKEAGYYTLDRKIGLDVEHAKLVVQALAKFHAMGIAMKNKKPEYFEILKHRSKSCQMKEPEAFVQMLASALEKASQKIPILAENFENCKSSICNITRNWMEPPKEPWSTIIHTDFWVNNFLFQKNSEGKVADVKFVDFQNYMFTHPLKDLVFLLGISLVQDISDQDFDLLLDVYHEALIGKLEKMNCDFSPFSKSEFNAQLEITGKVEFGHCFMMTKILTYNPMEADKMSASELQNLMVSEGTNALYLERLKCLTSRWAKKGWL